MTLARIGWLGPVVSDIEFLHRARGKLNGAYTPCSSSEKITDLAHTIEAHTTFINCRARLVFTQGYAWFIETRIVKAACRRRQSQTNAPYLVQPSSSRRSHSVFSGTRTPFRFFFPIEVFRDLFPICWALVP